SRAADSLLHRRHSDFDRDVWSWRFPHAALCVSGILVNLIQRIDHWATAAPEAIAHVSGDSTMTYGELRGRSDALASYLTKCFSDDRRPIAVLGHREPEMLIAFLGAVKSGRPYVPIDIALPQARIDQLLASSNAALTLTPDQTREFSTSKLGAPTIPVEKNEAFYILFTSGS